MDNEIETVFISNFICKNKKRRIIEKLLNPKTRKKMLDALNHFGDFDERYATPIVKQEKSCENIIKLLYSLGAPSNCYLISDVRELDGQMLALDEALKELFFTGGWGTLIVCIPDKLGLYYGEWGEYIWLLKK